MKKSNHTHFAIRLTMLLIITMCLGVHTSAMAAQMLQHQYAIVRTSDMPTLAPLHKQPDQNAGISYSYYTGTLVKVLGEQQSGWREVAIAGVRGYMEERYLEFVDFAEMETVLPAMRIKNKTDTGTLNLREKPSLESPIIRQYTNDEKVMVMGVSDDWYHVIGYGGRVGYMKPEFLEATGNTGYYTFSEDLFQLRPRKN